MVFYSAFRLPRSAFGLGAIHSIKEQSDSAYSMNPSLKTELCDKVLNPSLVLPPANRPRKSGYEFPDPWFSP